MSQKYRLALTGLYNRAISLINSQTPAEHEVKVPQPADLDDVKPAVTKPLSYNMVAEASVSTLTPGHAQSHAVRGEEKVGEPRSRSRT